MAIFVGGQDVTAEVHERVAKLALHERAQTSNFATAVDHLTKARDYLQGLPVPWQNDCIYDGIVSINAVIASLQPDKE